MLGCPTARRASAASMARLAFTAVVASASAAAGLGYWMETNLSVTRLFDLSSIAGWHYVGPVLMALLPPVAAWAVFTLRAPIQRLLTACACVPFAYMLALVADAVLEARSISHAYGGPLYGSSYGASLASELGALTPMAGILGMAAVLPIAPVLFLGRGGASDDHDMRARFRIGLCLALASMMELALILHVGRESRIEANNEYFCLLPSLLTLAFGVFEAVKARLVLGALRRWVERVRAGAVHGVRVRAHEPADAALYVPELVASPPIHLEEMGSLEVLEAYAEETDAPPYRRRQSAVPLARLPRGT